MPGERAQQAKENLFFVAGRHPHRAALALPTTEEELNENFPGLVRHLPEGDGAEAWTRFFADADAAYTSSSGTSFSFRDINQMLRSGTLPATRREGYRGVAVKLMMGMDPLRPDTALYRGLDRNAIPELKALCDWVDAGGLAGGFARYRGQKTFQDNGFVSTSTAERGAGKLVNTKGAKGILLLITTAAGCRGRIPDSQHRSEQELILAPGTRFTITGVAKGTVGGAGNMERCRISVTASFG